jgi:Tfp pilus assembly protein PilN
MINLVPDYLRTSNRYALRNSMLLRYTLVSASTMVAIGIITGLGILGMQRNKNNLQKQLDGQNQRLAAYKPLAAQGKQLSDELTTINTLLAHQVNFSTLLPGIAKVMPPGAVLKELDVSTSDLLPASAGAPATPGSAVSTVGGQQKPFIIQAAVLNRGIAATLLANIKASKDLFTDADIVSVTQSTENSTDANSKPSISTRYPYQVTINAYLKKINPKQLTSSSGAKK